MSLSLVHSRALLGLDARPVQVEVHLANGLPSFTLVGLADTEVKEARERVRSAIANAGLEFPSNKRITVNLAPADLPKDSGRFDLPIALGILAASGQIEAEPLARGVYAGELSLGGELRPVRGALAMALALAQDAAPRTLVLPPGSAEEAALVPGASHLTSPHYMGHMTAPLPAFTAELSRLLVMLNQNPMKMESSRLLSFLEREVLAKLHRLVYQENDGFYEAQMHAKDAALGVMTSGGTIANVTALWLARNRACGDDLFSLYEQGYRGAVILGSRLMHYSFDKGMDLLGLGARSVWRLETDEQNRLSLAALEQALIHLVQNAIDATEDGSPVFLDVSSEGLSGTIEVVDAGKGMSPEFVRAGLFKPFVSSKSGGFGIGAFEARELVRAMSGRVTVESREGLGTRFALTLPLAEAVRLLGARDADNPPDQEVA